MISPGLNVDFISVYEKAHTGEYSTTKPVAPDLHNGTAPAERARFAGFTIW